MGVCYCSMFCCKLLYVHSSIAIILMGKRELVALPNLASLWLVMVEWLFLTVPLGFLRFVIVAFPDHRCTKFNVATYWLALPFISLLNKIFPTLSQKRPKRKAIIRRHIKAAWIAPLTAQKDAFNKIIVCCNLQWTFYR